MNQTQHIEDYICYDERTKPDKLKAPPKVAPKPRRIYETSDAAISHDTSGLENAVNKNTLSSDTTECHENEGPDIKVKQSKIKNISEFDYDLNNAELSHNLSDSCGSSSSGVYSIIE